MCASSTIVTHRACNTCLRVQLSSNVRPHTELPVRSTALLNAVLAAEQLRRAPVHKAVLSGIVACGLLSIGFAVVVGAPDAALVVLAVSGVHMALLGLPAYAFLRWRGWANTLTATIAGGAVGALPVAALLFPGGGRYKGSSHWAGGVAQMIDGVPTEAGWLTYLSSVGFFSAFGVGAGLLFAIVLALWQRREA